MIEIKAKKINTKCGYRSVCHRRLSRIFAPGFEHRHPPSCGARDRCASKHSSGGFLCRQTNKHSKLAPGGGQGGAEIQPSSKSQEAFTTAEKLNHKM